MVGWWGLRREADWHGRGYWIRPLFIELGTGIGIALLYWLETQQHILWPDRMGVGAPAAAVDHAQYISHVVLIALMIVATFIDLDEQTIPDEITVTGTLAGLLLAVALPYSLLPTLQQLPGEPPQAAHMVVTSSTVSPDGWTGGLGGSFSWPTWLNRPEGLLLGLLGIWAWCLAILHRTWTLRQGWWRGVQFMMASIVRRATWRVPCAVGLFLSAVAAATWWGSVNVGTGIRWQALLSSIAGMCFGGGLIWAVRIIGGYAMRVEAMGFGDVTLMAMIGAFLGWQAAFLIFFLAPLTAVVIAALQRVVAGEQHIAFGPYLCAATLIVIVMWDQLWTDWARPMFSLGWFIPGILVCCLVMMGGMLWLWRIVRDALFS